jgi:hypothetical protein
MGLWESFLRGQPDGVDFARLPGGLQMHLSKTLKQETMVAPGTEGLPGSTYALKDMALDEVQAGLDRALVWLRRRVFLAPGQDGQVGPMPLSQRPTFAAPVYTSDPDPRWASHLGDPPGAYGYRQAQVVNGLQSFTKEEAGDTFRTIDKSYTWGKDPANYPWEIAEGVPENNRVYGRLVPILSQRFKLDAGTFNPYNVMVHYLVAYPSLRSGGTPENGLYPINVLLTRDLLVGPMGTYIDANQPLTGASLKAERLAIDKAIRAINALPNWSDAQGVDRGHYATDYDDLKSALEAQDIVVDTGGSYFNRGLGMLQLALAKSVHVTFPGDRSAYLPFQNPNVAYLTADPQDWDYSRNPAFNANIQGDISGFIYDHVKAARMEVLVNGIQNKAEEVDESAQALQRRLDDALGTTDPKARTPVMAQYNVSSKLYYGSVGKQRDPMDLWDCIAQKEDAAHPDRVTTNRDAIRLIATLRSLTQTIWSRDYQLDFYQTHLNPLVPRELWCISVLGGTQAELIGELLSADAPMDELDNRFVQFVPKNHATLEEDFPDPVTRQAHIASAAEAFKAQMKSEFIRLYAKLATLPVTLHTHSQGAIIAAVVQSRLGFVPATRKNLQGVVRGDVGVADKIDLVTYGGAANMYDWGPMKWYRSYTHHVNMNDAVAKLGMGDPFQRLLKGALLGTGGIGDLIGSVDDSASQIRLRPPQLLLDAWKNFHTVIYHPSSAGFLNIEEHNLTTGYVCNAHPDSSTLIPMSTPNKFEGKARCNDLQSIH